MSRHFQLVKVLTVAAFLFSSCGKKKGTYYPITSNMLREAATIKDGSYFVYRDSISGVEDSFTVSWYQYYPFVSVENNNTAEHISYRMLSTSGQAIGMVLGGANDIAASRLGGSYSNGSEECGVKYLQDPFVIGLVDNNPFFSTNNIEFRNNITITGQVYDSIYIIQSISLSSVYGRPDSLSMVFTSYYSPRNGLVKYDVKNSHTHHVWELQRSQIIK